MTDDLKTLQPDPIATIDPSAKDPDAALTDSQKAFIDRLQERSKPRISVRELLKKREEEARDKDD